MNFVVLFGVGLCSVVWVLHWVDSVGVVSVMQCEMMLMWPNGYTGLWCGGVVAVVWQN